MSLGEPAIPLVEPVTKDISAELGWQNTGILLGFGETIKVQFLSGEIRDGDSVSVVQPELGLFDNSGSFRIKISP